LKALFIGVQKLLVEKEWELGITIGVCLEELGSFCHSTTCGTSFSCLMEKHRCFSWASSTTCTLLSVCSFDLLSHSTVTCEGQTVETRWGKGRQRFVSLTLRALVGDLDGSKYSCAHVQHTCTQTHG
jgi:hypothetical protein